MRDTEQQSQKPARRLRQSMTQAETILWSRLRRRAVEGSRFRRQHPIGPYVADFACIPARLIVEVDGATHSTDAEIARDSRREGYLTMEGWRVLRVHNDDVFKRLDDVMSMIWNSLPPSPASGRTSPASGGGKNSAA